MKKEELKKIREKNVTDLAKESQTSKERLWQLRMDLASGKIKNVSEIRKLRKRIAIINTIIKGK